MLLIALLVILLLVFYSTHLKRTVIWGNLVVSSCTAAAFIYGGLAVKQMEVVLFPALFAFLFHFGREIVKDIEDIEGDRRDGANTLAVQYGPQIAAWLILFIFVVLVVVTILPYILDIYNILYMTIVILGIYPILVTVWYQTRTNPVPHRMRLMSQILKVDMLIGLAAIYLG
jgi:geranylgeranylglycerol-phosphate geranylgeranyltransferase